MKNSKLKSAMLSLALLAGAAVSHAQTVTVGPSGQYPTPCAAFPNLVDGETVQVDANGGTPYAGQADCKITNNNLTIVGVNGRAIIDGSGTYTSKGLWVVNGHDIVIDNFEFRNASGSQNAEAFRIQNSDGNSTPDGGNVTLQHSYVHDNGTGVLSENAFGPGSGLEWYSSSPYIMFQYDEFVHNGNHDGQGNTHNIYIGFDTAEGMTFTIQYSWSHDSYVGHTLKDRSPNSNVLYNLFSDEEGNSSYLNQFPLGGSTYIVGNSYYKAATTNGNSNQAMLLYADASDNNVGVDPEYGPPHQDLHFVNNTMVDDPANGDESAYVNISCLNSDNSQCPQPNAGPPVTTNAVVENNIFVGDGTQATNQLSAYQTHNILEANTSSNLAAMFVDAAHFDYHLAAGSPAIQAGIYPPTDNTGAADPKALAVYEHVVPVGAVTRPTPSGSTMDAGAFSYPRVNTQPTLNLNYTSNVTAPGTGTITISGLPTPPAGQYNYASFISSNQAAVPNPPSADSTTGTITTTFTVNPAVTQSTVVPIDIYADDVHLVANVTVNPGPPVLSSVTQDWNYAPFSSVHLEGPAPAGGTVINLSSSDPTYLYVPSTVTVPQGQISAETGSNTGSLWGQNPGAPTETITATQGSITKTASFGVFAPGFHNYPGPEYSTSQSGQPSLWCVVMVGYFPNSGGNIQVTSDTPSVVPNQTITSGYGGCNGNGQGQVIGFTSGVNFNGDIAVATNPVSVNTTVNVTLNLNGAIATGAITLTPGSGGGGTPPNAPSNLSSSSSSPTVANLSWTASTTSGVTYSVFRSTTSGSQGSQIASGIGTTTYTDLTAAASTTYYYEVEAVNSGGTSGATNQSSATTPATSGGSGADVIDINSGGAAASPYAADEDSSGNGLSSTVSTTISTTGVTNPAPQAVYQSQIYAGNGNITYTIPGLVAGDSYTVRLHFAETYFASAGQREFDVVINGTQVMTNFDIVAAAGGENNAVVESFPAVANSSGQIVIGLNNDAQNYAALNGIQIQEGSVAVSSGSGQSANVGSNFANPLAVVVKDANGNPLSGATVTFAGTGVSFPNGATAVTNGSGVASVTAQPTQTGALTVTASVAGFASTASFSETGTSGVTVASVTLDNGDTYRAATTVTLSGPAPAGGAVVTITSSNQSTLYAPSSVTVPAGQTSAEIGTMEGALWGQSPATKTATLTATYNGSSKSLTQAYSAPGIHGLGCDYSCTVKGGTTIGVSTTLRGDAPHTPGSVSYTSSNTAVIPNQSFALTANAYHLDTQVTTKAVTSNKTVTLTISYNGDKWASVTITVTP